jgi:hypothetical protein
MSSASTTTDHDEIRQWVEQRGGHPVIVSDTENNGRAGGMLRIDFDDPGGEDDMGLHRIKWEEFFEVFDASELAFLRGEGDSRFNKFVARENSGR